MRPTYSWQFRLESRIPHTLVVGVCQSREICKKSLEQASNLAIKFLYISIDSEDEDYYKKEILNAYNLENIK